MRRKEYDFPQGKLVVMGRIVRIIYAACPHVSVPCDRTHAAECLRLLRQRKAVLNG